MRQYVDLLAGDTASRCHGCRETRKRSGGKAICERNEEGVCPLPRPQLDDGLRSAVLELFLDCARANLWVRSDYTGARSHIDRAQLQREADARGFVLTEDFLDKFSICESVIRSQDNARLAADAESREI
jgi:hypothetical protein